MRFRKIVKLFENECVCVLGKKGRGKDMLMANVIERRKLPYISNMDYNALRKPFDYSMIDLSGNDYKTLLNGNIKPYSYPYKDDEDFYISDCGIYFPSQYCNDLNRAYPQLAMFQALSRHFGARFHVNCQQLSRVYDKIREQSDCYILCLWCKVIGRLVIQRVRIYDNAESASQARKPLRLPKPLIEGKDHKLQRRIQEQNYEALHGTIREGILIYWNKSNYDTRRFKTIFEKGDTT